MIDLSRYAALGEGAHIQLRTYRTDGSAVDTPVWFERIDHKLYLRTVRSSAKIKRLLQNPRIQFAPCLWNGELTGDWQEAEAQLLETGDPLVDELEARMDQKYGDYRREMTELMAGLGKTLCFVEITPANHT